jgi:hypothetical protein
VTIEADIAERRRVACETTDARSPAREAWLRDLEALLLTWLDFSNCASVGRRLEADLAKVRAELQEERDFNRDGVRAYAACVRALCPEPDDVTEEDVLGALRAAARLADEYGCDAAELVERVGDQEKALEDALDKATKERAADAALVAEAMAGLARDRKTLERMYAYAQGALEAAERFVFRAKDGQAWHAYARAEEGEPGAWRILRTQAGESQTSATEIVGDEENRADAIWECTQRREKADQAFAAKREAETYAITVRQADLLQVGAPDGPDVRDRTSPEDAEALLELLRLGFLEKAAQVQDRNGFWVDRLVTTDAGRRALARFQGMKS